MADFHPENILNALIYALLGILIFVFVFVLIDKLTPYHLWREVVEDKNIALAILVGAVRAGHVHHHRRRGALGRMAHVAVFISLGPSDCRLRADL